MKYFYFLLFMLLQVVTVSGNPALPGQWKMLTLTDGTQVNAELKGDKFCHYWQTSDGRCFAESNISGVYESVSLQELQNNALKNVCHL